jgi:hypothetical protein
VLIINMNWLAAEPTFCMYVVAATVAGLLLLTVGIDPDKSISSIIAICGAGTATATGAGTDAAATGVARGGAGGGMTGSKLLLTVSDIPDDMGGHSCPCVDLDTSSVLKSLRRRPRGPNLPPPLPKALLN